MTKNAPKNREQTGQIFVAIIGVIAACIGGLAVVIAALISIGPTIFQNIGSSEDSIETARNWPIVAADNFSNETSRRHWTRLENPAGSIEETFDSGFRIDVQTVGDGHAASHVFYFNEDAVLRDRFLISVDAALSLQSGCMYGIIFRGTLDENFYSFYIWPPDSNPDSIFTQAYGLVRKAPGQEKKFEDIIPLTNLRNDLVISTLSVLGNGSNYKFYVNDVLIDEANDDRLRGSKAGIGTITCSFLESAHFVFDNFEVRAP
jgi:hypothetical protein